MAWTRRISPAALPMRPIASVYEAACSRSAHCFGVLAGPCLDLLPLRLHLHQLGGELARRRLQGLLLARRLERLCVGLRQQQPQRPGEVLPRRRGGRVAAVPRPRGLLPPGGPEGDEVEVGGGGAPVPAQSPPEGPGAQRQRQSPRPTDRSPLPSLLLRLQLP